MTIVSTQIKYDTQHPEMKKWAKENIKHQMIMEMGRLVCENREGVICISPLEHEEFPEFDYRPSMTIKVSAKYEFAHSFPVYIHEGFVYQSEHVRPPSSLNFLERVKFIFTGKYPK